MTTYTGGSSVFEVRSAATAGNKGGGGFNPANANFIANWTATSANTASPVLSSVSYSFVAGDVGAWVYVNSGTNWTPGWYQIASVGGGNATLNADIGAAIQVSNNRYLPSTVAGCATVASPTAGNVGIDYSQQNAAQFTATDLTGATTTCTSATNPFGVQHAGNFLCFATGTGVTAGFYEIVSVSGTTATLDRTAGTTYSGVTYYLGGAVSLGGSTTGITDAIFLALGGTGIFTAGNRFFIKKGSYTPNGSITGSAGNIIWPVTTEGYNSVRGDRPTIASGNQPTLNTAANTFTGGISSQFFNISFTGTSTAIFNTSTNTAIRNCRVINTSTTASRPAIAANGATSIINACECISYNGYGIQASVASVFMVGNYIHDCNIGISIGGVGNTVVDNIICSCTTGCINEGNGGCFIWGNTLYGAENKLGYGINNPTNLDVVYNNIFYGLVTAIAGSSAQNTLQDYNAFFNNTANIQSGKPIFLGANDLTATNPSFTSAAQLTGSTATTTSGNHLVQAGATFVASGVTPGRDYLYVISGTGVVAGRYGIISVDSATQITVDNTLSADATANKVWQITTGRNFAVGTALKATGSLGVFPGGLTTGYLDIGAAQRQEPAAGGAYTFGF